MLLGRIWMRRRKEPLPVNGAPWRFALGCFEVDNDVAFAKIIHLQRLDLTESDFAPRSVGSKKMQNAVVPGRQNSFERGIV